MVLRCSIQSFCSHHSQGHRQVVGDLCRYSVYLSMTVVSPRTEEAIKKHVEFMTRNSLCIVEAEVRYQQQMGVSMLVASGHWNIADGSTKGVIE